MARRGVFKIVNKQTGTVYVGSSNTDMDRLIDSYWAKLYSGSHHNRALQSDFDYYGSSNFEYIIVNDNCYSENEVRSVREREIYLNRYNTYNKHDVNNKIKNININNRVFMDQLDIEVDLDKLIVELNDYDASYEPEQFPGMNFKDNHGITYLLFGSGKITITGVKSLDNFEEHVNEFKELIFEKSNK